MFNSFKWGITLFLFVLLAWEVLNEATLNETKGAGFRRSRNKKGRDKNKTGPLHADLKDDGNGWKVIHGSYPGEKQKYHYMAYISGLNDKKMCSAIVTTPSMVITAARCVTLKYSITPVPTDGLSVFAGHVNYLRGTELKVKKIHIHPDYIKNEKWTQYMDFAWLDLYGEYQTGPELILAPLVCPSIKDYYKQMQDNNRECRFAGWDNRKNSPDGVYRFIFYPQLISDQQCKQEWEAFHDFDYKINPEVHVCTKATEWQNGCEGDYGGGLFCEDHILGVFSMGERCEYSGIFPMVYTRMDKAFPAIAGYLPQMNETTQHECAADFKPGEYGSSDAIAATSFQSPVFHLIPIIWYWVPLLKEVLKLNYFDEDLIRSSTSWTPSLPFPEKNQH